MLRSWLISSDQSLEVLHSSEMSVTIYKSVWFNISEDLNAYQFCCKNLKSQREICVCIILIFSIAGKYVHNYIVSVQMYARCAVLQFKILV